MNTYLTSTRFLEKRRLVFRVTAIYVLMATIWMFLSNRLPGFLTRDPSMQEHLALTFDLVLVTMTAALLAWAMRRFLGLLRGQERDLGQMVESVCTATGEEFFQTLVLNLTKLLNADYAFICRYTNTSRQQVKTMAVCADGRITENIEFLLAGTPCAEVVSKGMQSYPQELRKVFPHDHLAHQLEVESYVGVPLRDSNGEVLGPMAVFSRTPLDNPAMASTMLQLFAVRAAAELERRQAEKTIDYLASYDALTGLPNRRMYDEQLTRALAAAGHYHEYIAVMILDLDRFKNINDTLGHAMGDRLLTEVATRLSHCLPHQHGTVARMGGDEFLLFSPGLKHVGEAVTFATNTLEALKPAFCIANLDLHVTASLGMALFPNDGGDGETLVQNADTALNRAKMGGRDHYQFYTADMNAMSRTRLDLENHLRRALEREELFLCYQPQIDLATGRICGVEALLRWRHPERGLVSPNEFIPLAEETGLIVSIGAWVLKTACRRAQAWQRAGLPALRIAVNLSARQFFEANLVGMVAQVLEDTGLTPGNLELEITESLIMEDIEGAVEKLNQLRSLGVRIAIDDFGTGYSSLSYLKRFPIQVLKIDRSFIQDIGRNPDDTAIVGGVIALAHNLSLEVVAEGVETQPQEAFLRDHGCDVLQGFLFSPPVPEPALTELLAAAAASSPLFAPAGTSTF